MKKMMCLVLALAMMLCAAGAMAASLPNGTKITRQDGSTAKPCSSSEHEFGQEDGDYCLGPYGMLSIHQNNLTVREWTSVGGHIFINGAGIHEVTLDNVHITHNISAVYIQNIDKFTLNLNNATLVGNTSGVSMQGLVGVAPQLTVTGNGSITGNTSGINVSVNGGNQLPASCTLDGNLTVSGGEKAVVLINGSPHTLNIGGAPGKGILVYAGDDERTAAALNDGKPYYETTDVLRDVIVKETDTDMSTKKYIRTELVISGQTAADLPQTGDESRLALWLCLLAIAGAGMTAMRKREA